MALDKTQHDCRQPSNNDTHMEQVDQDHNMIDETHVEADEARQDDVMIDETYVDADVEITCNDIAKRNLKRKLEVEGSSMNKVMRSN